MEGAAVNHARKSESTKQHAKGQRLQQNDVPDKLIFELVTHTGLCLHARAVVLAVGAGAYQRRPLDLPGAEQWRGTQIFEEPSIEVHFPISRHSDNPTLICDFLYI